jgi:putative transposase
MAIPQRTATTGTFFITTITYNRRRIFQVPANAELFLEALQHYRTQGAYKLHAFVVMPDHAHLLLTPIDKTISQTMNLIKGGFSRRLASSFPIWQRGFADHLVLPFGVADPGRLLHLDRLEMGAYQGKPSSRTLDLPNSSQAGLAAKSQRSRVAPGFVVRGSSC